MLPPPLRPGDRLAVILPSGALRETTGFQAGIELWQQQGYQVDVHPQCSASWGYLAGADQQRREALRAVLLDPNIKGILCGRGGFGATRLLETWAWPEHSPKWLIGFSDITALLWSYASYGVVGIHGPVLTTLAAEPLWTRARLFNLVQHQAVAPLHGQAWVGGVVQGILWPGNLTVASHLLATQQLPAWSRVILALEDVGEAPYRLDRMLTQWRQTSAFQQVVGLALGRFSQCDPPGASPSLAVVEVLKDRCCDLGIPVVADLPFGHDGENAALPVGVPVELDGNQARLSLLEAKSHP
ncbi:LD-carboxypeptidase [Thermosynechococcaceae cyanobacterium BACA0444]|uniref:LD-carboxypeptidase n=1 Tax=Pseudocalidococcus azoricus BACA0444 TaxID=2918990 RepID=A0AAE4FVX8_9CYAN|nr:LD-carboxypeptidase [Pseudocalidococcus azoricus]MDS3862041.1 LD-carboxypeptidase [Pseudocalidococcus azoricus BACA0444]